MLRGVTLPGDPTPIEAARLAYGMPATLPTIADRTSAERLGVVGIEAEIGDALIDLGCWRQRVRSLPVGPALINELADRPDALAPPPLGDPDRALAIAATAREMRVGDRIVSNFANAVLESITARAKAVAWLQAEQHTDLAMLSRNYPGLYEMLPTEVGFALRTSEAEAGGMISLARAFARRLPGTLEALRQGLINHGHAMAIARATSTTTPEIAGQVEADLLPQVTAPGSTITAEQLRRRAVRRVIKLDPDGAVDRHRKAAVDRRITRWMEEDGMAGMKVYAPAQDIAIIWDAATTLADAAKTPGDGRNLGNRRVDALTDLCADILYRQTRVAAGDVHAPTTPDMTNDSVSDFDSARTSTSCKFADEGETDAAAAGSAGANADGTKPADSDSADTNAAGTDSADMNAAGTESADMNGSDIDSADTNTSDISPAGPNDDGTGTAGTSAANTGSADMNAADTSSSDTSAADTCSADTGSADTDSRGRATDLAAMDVPSPGISGSAEHAVVERTPTGKTRPANPLVLPKYHGQRPHIQVVIPYTVLLGGNEPCELVGHGAITADQARLIAADGVLRRLITDPLSGTLLDYGRTRYEPPESLKQFVITRDGTCQAPGCLQPAHRGQIDHVEGYRPGQPTGGDTNHTNLRNYCRHHHRAKDGGGFTNTVGPDGSSDWVTPLGRHYSRPPNEIWHQEDHDSQGNANDSDATDLDDGFPTDYGRVEADTANTAPGHAEVDTAEDREEPPPPF